MNDKIITVAMNPSIDKTINIDKLLPYGLNRIIRSRLDPGGKGINVARVLKNFGAHVIVSALIAGENGRRLERFLEQAGIRADLFQTGGETRINMKVVDDSVNRTTEFNEPGCRIDGKTVEAYRVRLESLFNETDIAVFSGSLPPGVPSDFYEESIQMARDHGIRTLLDADGEALAQGIRAVPYAVKPNIHELETLIGCKCRDWQDVADAAWHLISGGIAVVIVSMGPDGAIVVGHGAAYKVDTWDIPVKSTVGAGDSMVGSLAWSIQRNDSLYDIAKITTAAGTITASKAGTEICTSEEVMRSLDHVAVHEIPIRSNH